MIESFEFKGADSGPAVLFFGAIHGNEVCGPTAIRRVMDEISSGSIAMLRGSVTFVPVCNPKACEQHVRYTEENLNRIFRPTENPASYEARLANELCPLVERCDIFLDLHSMTANGEPFIFIDFPSDVTRAFADILGANMAIVGWPELYARPETEQPSHDTTMYAAEKGKVGLLIECGQHDDPKAVDVAYRAIRNTLIHFGLIDGSVTTTPPTIIKMERVYFKKSDDQRFLRDWKHLQPVNKGEALFTDETGSEVVSPLDGYVIMPKEIAKVGEEWMYLGRASA